MREQRFPILVLLALLFIPGLACQQSNVPPYLDIELDVDGVGTVFIWAAGSGDEQTALSMLSTKAQADVTRYCENGEVIACFNQVGLQDWGRLKPGDIGISFLSNYSGKLTPTYQVHWNRDTYIWMKLEIVDETGEWRVNSWRVWISPDNEFPEGLINGSGYTHHFPPEE